MRGVFTFTIGLVLVFAAAWLLSGSTPVPAHAALAGGPVPPCGTPQVSTGSITGSDAYHANFLNEQQDPDVCSSPRSCPGVFIDPSPTPMPFHYDTYTFFNPDAAPRKVTVQVNPKSCGEGHLLYSSAYLDSFNPENLCQNWVASTGNGVTQITTYSFTVPASGTFVIDVEEYYSGDGCASYGLSVTVECNTCCSMTFTDVHPTDYFYEPVRYLYCRGVISGYGDNTFRPYNNTTRGQLAKIVVAAEGWPIDTTGGPHFNDVPTSNPFYGFIETAFNRQIISGYACGGPGEPCPGLYFRWGNNVTRAQLSKIVVLAEGWTIDTTGGPHFSDVPTTDPFYGVIETAFNRGIISGYADGTFRPGSNATRGQICKIVYNAVTQP